jgi:hypothetical protein
MAVQSFCEKCKQTSEVLFDKNTKKTHCGNCDEVVIIANKFLVARLVDLGQVRNGAKRLGATAFDLYCEKCNKKVTPILKDKKIFCGCGGGFDKISKIIYNFTVEKLTIKAKEQENENQYNQSQGVRLVRKLTPNRR